MRATLYTKRHRTVSDPIGTAAPIGERPPGNSGALATAAVHLDIVNAFSSARYNVRLPRGWLEIRVGMDAATIDARLAMEAGVTRDWAIVTPFNPGAVCLPETTNQRRLIQLKHFLEQEKRTWFAAENVDADALWPVEEGCLLVDPGLAYAVLLAQRFGQLALLHGEVGGSPHLHWV